MVSKLKTNFLSENDFYKALENVILPEDDVIVIYSGIWSFGGHFPWNIRELPDKLLDIIEDFVGENRTLLLPSFCSKKFVATRKYDLSDSSSIETGVISKAALARGGYRRTKQPMFSFLVRGPRTDEILAQKCTTSWGRDSVLAWLGKVNARICPLGLPWRKGCSYFHKIEDELHVPYRFYKRFAGALYKVENKVGPCEEVHYVYSLRVPLEYDFLKVQTALQRSGKILDCKNPLITLQSAKTKIIDEVCNNVFSRDPYAIVTNKDQVKNWVNKGKKGEVASLAPDEQWR